MPLLHLHVGGQVIRTTAEHPFFVRGEGWRAARLLQAGQSLRSHDDRWLKVDDVRQTDEVAPVYNLRVADYHTYWVGSRDWGFSVWTHNACRLDSRVKGVRAPGRYDTSAGSLDEARQIVRTALPDAVELEPAIAGQPYPSPPPGTQQWFQVHPPEPSVGNNMPHFKYADWTAGKKGSGGSWGHIFFPSS